MTDSDLAEVKNHAGAPLVNFEVWSPKPGRPGRMALVDIHVFLRDWEREAVEFRYTPPEYSRQTGLIGEFEGDDYRIQVSVEKGTVYIDAKREGLILLAKHLLTLAQRGVPSWAHFHLDPELVLESGSVPLVLGKLPDVDQPEQE